MSKFVEEYSDVNVEGVEFYVPQVADGFLYKDSECTEKVDGKTLEHAFEMNDVIIVDGGISYRAIGSTKADFDSVVIYYASITDSDGLAIVPKQVKSYDAKLITDVNIAVDEDLLGKVVGDLQSDIVIGEDEITGTLKYVTGYTGFSSKVEEQSGNYLALHCITNTGSDIYVEVINGFSGPVKLDPDGLIILRIANKDQKVKVTSGNIEHIYGLENIILASE